MATIPAVRSFPERVQPGTAAGSVADTPPADPTVPPMAPDTATGGVWPRATLPVRPRRRTWSRSRLLFAGGAVTLALGYFVTAAMQSGAVYYLTVAELSAKGIAAYDERVRVAAKVVNGSIQRQAGLLQFTVADDLTKPGGQTLRVAYRGVVPDVFADEVDVVVEGKLAQNGVFEATTLLAKCPSRYEGATPPTAGAVSGHPGGQAATSK
jgi:cytochrome c-type biogenesis protein CcmE